MNNMYSKNLQFNTDVGLDEAGAIAKKTEYI